MPVTIELFQRKLSWRMSTKVARIKGDDKLEGTGRTVDEAVGNLIMNYGVKFGLRFEYRSNFETPVKE